MATRMEAPSSIWAYYPFGNREFSNLVRYVPLSHYASDIVGHPAVLVLPNCDFDSGLRLLGLFSLVQIGLVKLPGLWETGTC